MPSDSPAMAIGETTAELLDACCRLVGLLDKPEDIPFLSGLIQREIIYRVLQEPAGARLRAIATLGDQSQRMARAIAWIRTNYAKPLRVEELAQLAGMGVSTLHHHFRLLTAMSPFSIRSKYGCRQRETEWSWTGWTPLAPHLRSDTKAPHSLTANTAVSSDNHQCATFELFARQVLLLWCLFSNR